jgi:hypothetical protein
VNAQFFALAFSAAVNPSLLGVDLVLIVNQRPRAMLAFVLIGGMLAAITIGLIDVLVIRANVVKTQGGLSAGADLALGMLLLIAAGWLMFWRQPSPASSAAGDGKAAGKSNWTQRALREPRLGLAGVVGVVLGLPGVLYLTALHNLVSGGWSVAMQVAGVIVFVLIEFTLLIVPLLTLSFWPERTAALLHGSQAWLLRHGRQMLAWVALVLGVYLTISGIVNLA